MNRNTIFIITGIILCLILLRGMLYGLIVPFDQAPDEKHHFLLIKSKQLAFQGASQEERRQTAARIEVAHYYLQYPDAPAWKRSVEDYGDSKLPRARSSRHIYYAVTGWLLSVCSFDDIRADIYMLRGFSVLCGTLVVMLSMLIVSELFPDDRFLRLGIPLFIAFVPQFSAMNGVINNDKLAEVFASLLFLIIVKIFKYGISWRYAMLYLAAAILALMSKRTTIFILPLSVFLLFFLYWKGQLGLRMHLVLIGVCLAMIGLTYLLLFNPTIYRLVDEHVISIKPARYLPQAIFRPALFTKATLLHIAKFFTVMYWGFWGIFGYMTIHLHHFWYLAAAGVQTLSIAGLGKIMVRAKQRKYALAAWKAKVYYLFGSSVILTLLIPVLRSIILNYGKPDLTQGRYLFTVMIPIAVLTMLGLAKLFPPKYHRWIGGIGLCAIILLDTIALGNYIFVNFHYVAFF